ncbi:unnamed protein product [Ixodes hexagonus]
MTQGCSRMAPAKRPKVTLDPFFQRESGAATLDAPTCTAETVTHKAACPESTVSDDVAGEVSNVSDNDIGLCVLTGPKRQKIKDDETRRRLLMNPWKPGSKYCFATLGKRKFKFQTQWTEKYPWLVYSRCQGQEGALCNVCVLFGQECSGKGSHQKLGGLVLTRFVRWKNALETFKAHSESEYHKTAVLDADNFVQAVQGEPVKERMDSAARVQRQTNRKKLMSIIEVVLLCGRQGIALRGHRDAGSLTLEDPLENDGNFRALVCLKIRSGDDLLRDHLETAPGNATYVPKPTNTKRNLGGEQHSGSAGRRRSSQQCEVLLLACGRKQQTFREPSRCLSACSTC